jgi:HEAT repeat protein
VRLLDDPVEEVRDEAYVLVDGSAYAEAWPVLERHVGSDDWLVRLHALSAMWRVDPKRALPFAQRLRGDEEGLVRDAATDMAKSVPG